MATRKATACAIAFLPLLLTAACSTSSQYGPLNSAYFEQTVKKSLGSSHGEIYTSLRSNWIPYKKKPPVGGIFIVAGRRLIFAT